MSEILCMSGGLDSVIAWYYLGKPPVVYFDTGLPFCEKELAAVRSIVGGNFIIDKSLNFSNEKEIHIPHRNLLFASRASNYADIVYMAGLKDDMVEDKTLEAFEDMSCVISKIGKKTVTVRSPFWDMTKTDICKWFKGANDNAEQILRYLSVSCYAGSSEPCYECESCFRKACAMHNAGMKSRFDNRAMVEDYWRKAREDEYIRERNADIIKYAWSLICDTGSDCDHPIKNADSDGFKDLENHGLKNPKNFKIGKRVRARDSDRMPWIYGMFAGYNDRGHFQWHMITDDDMFIGFEYMESASIADDGIIDMR